MVRGGYYTNPSEKKIEFFDNFTGGLNTVTTNSNLSDIELVHLENADLDARGDITRRLGMQAHLDVPVNGKGQGYFRYYYQGGAGISNKNHIKRFTDSSWVTKNGVIATWLGYDRISFQSNVYGATESGSNVEYLFDTVAVSSLKGKQATLSLGDYNVALSDGYVYVHVKTVTNQTFTKLAEIKSNAAIKVYSVTMTFPSDVTDIRIMITRDNATNNGSTITIQKMQMEIGAVATSYQDYKVSEFDEIVAINGFLYKNGAVLPITGLESGFQTTRKIEAVQFKQSLFIATGSKLVEYDGTIAKVIDPYKPVGQEALYVGYNGLFPDPINYASDSTNTFIALDAVLFDKRYGIVNTPIQMTFVITKPSADVIEYKTEIKKVSDTSYTIVKDWATAATGRVVTYTPKDIGDYMFQFTIRKQGTTGQDIVYNVPKYSVKATDENTTLSCATMQTCNRIFIHNDRLCMYGDTTYPNQLYFSHLDKPRYFPVNNTIDFKSDRQEGLTAVVKYRNILIAFTPSNIQALYGTSPLDFTKKVINASLGCIAPYSACVVENAVNFVSKEGIFALVSMGTVDDRMNVRRLDERIWNILPKSTNCVGVYFNKQYHLVYPTDKLRFRYYTQMGVWTKDKSTKMTLNQLTEWDGILIGQQSDLGGVVKFDPSSTATNDLGEVYTFAFETREFDFGVPNHIKVLKQMQIRMKVQAISSGLKVFVSADAKLVATPDKTEVAIVNGEVQWITTSDPNMIVDAGTVLGSWVMGKSAFGQVDERVNKVKISGKCRKTKLRIEHTEDMPCRFLGVAYIFKLRKPK